MGISIRDLKDHTDLETEKSFVSYSWITWIVIRRILNINPLTNNVPHHIETHLHHSDHSFSICFATDHIRPEIYCRQNWHFLTSQARQMWSLKLHTIKLTGSLCKWVLKIESNWIGWSTKLHFFGMHFSVPLDQLLCQTIKPKHLIFKY